MAMAEAARASRTKRASASRRPMLGCKLQHKTPDRRHILRSNTLNRRSGDCINYVSLLERMRFGYNKFWKLLIDRHMQKQELAKLSNVSSTSLAKLAKDKNVTTDILLRIYEVLDVELGDIVEIARGE